MVFVRTLGSASIDAGTAHLTPSSSRRFAFCLYLWAERGRTITRATLHDLIFPEQTATNARHSIREQIYQFRKLGARIASDGETVELAPESIRADYCDVLQQDRPSLEQLKAAEGGFLPGYAPTLSEAFTEWLEGFRRRATLELTRAFVAELNRARRLSDWALAGTAARAILALDPMHEEATLASAELLAVNGAKTEAVRLLDRYVEEVGTASPDLKLPATLLRRRISERSREIYRAPLTLPFLGRDVEMATLQERFERARAGEAQCVVIVGEAGIGKTRLAEELSTQAVLVGARVERLAAQPYDVHRPMSTFADLVPRLFELPGSLGCSPKSIVALQRLTTQEDELPVLDFQATGETVVAAIARAIADLIDSIVSESTLVLLIDDAHWIDERSWQTLTALAAERQARRLMIVMTSRERSIGQMLAQRSERLLAIPLSPLTMKSARELADRALREHATADNHLREWIASTSGGNPFFLKCLIDHYAATGERFVVPTRLNTLLDQKIVGLSQNAVAVLGTCVALGRHSEISRLVRSLEMPQIDLQLAAAELEAANLIAHRGARIEPTHSLVIEAVIRLSSPFLSRLIHRRVASILEAEIDDSVSPVMLWDCAEHWTLAGEQERAAEFLQQCSARTLQIGRQREAAELLLRAAAMVDRERAILLARDATEIAHEAHEGDVVKRAIRLLRELNVAVDSDPLELAELHALVCEWDDPEYAIQRLTCWLASGAPLSHRVQAALELVVIAEVDDRSELARLVGEVIQELPDPVLCTDRAMLTLLLIYHASFGDTDQVPTIATQLLTIARELGAIAASDIWRKVGVALWRIGALSQADDAFRHAHASAKSVGLLKVQFDTANFLSGLLIDVGDPEAAEWERAADTMASSSGELASRPTYVLLRLDNACRTGDAKVANEWLCSATRLYESNRLGRVRRWINAAGLRVRELQGDLPKTEEVEHMVERHRANMEIADIGDFEVAVGLNILRQRGAIERAQTLLEKYLIVDRRTRNPLTRFLCETIASLGIRMDRPGLRRHRCFSETQLGSSDSLFPERSRTTLARPADEREWCN
jgi:DNA-binding SARP family transcriptional activator